MSPVKLIIFSLDLAWLDREGREGREGREDVIINILSWVDELQFTPQT